MTHDVRRVLAAMFLLSGCGDDGDAPVDTAASATEASTGSTPGSADATGGTSAADDVADDSSGDDDSTGDPIVEIDCTDACVDTTSDAGIAVCYACRCKAAMDGYLPPPELLQCDLADPLTIFTADLTGASPTVVPQTTDEPTCANPALLTESCQTGSRLGQLDEGDITVKWICRDPVGPPLDVYADVGVIMYNARNGATCWFDDIDTVTDDDNLPDLDLMEAGEDNLAGFLERFYFTDGYTCSRDCHDADPFIYTPYLASTGWYQGMAHTLGPYQRVTIDGTLAPIESTHLTNPEVVLCTTCHRLGSAAGCDFLGPDSLGDYKTAAHEDAIVDATDPGSPNWSLAYWMPFGPQEASLAAWLAKYGEAKDTYTTCCQNPGVATPECTWEPIPTE